MVIATSQVALGVRGEQELWLEPLELPKYQQDVLGALDQLPGAVEMFSKRARRRNPTFKIGADNARDIIEIVRMLDGLPLAIELAAAQMRHLSPAALRQRLEHALPSLSGGPPDLPERQRSLLNMMQWSRSLIKRVVTEAQEPARFFKLNTVQAVALHLLRQQPIHYLEASVKHAEACLIFAREAANYWHGDVQVEWFQRMESEHANIERVIEHALNDPRMAGAALELTEPLCWYWYSRGYHGWALQRIESILQLAPENLTDHVRGAAHVSAGWLAFKRTQVARAEHHFTEGLRLIPDPASPPALRGSIGMSYVISFAGENTEPALRQLEGVIQRAKKNPAAWHELATGHFGWGLTNYFNNHVESARAGFGASLQIARGRNDKQSIAMNLLYLAHTDRIDGKAQSAIRKLQEVFPIFQDMGDESNMLLSLDVVTFVLADLGELKMARRIGAFSEHTRRSHRTPRSLLEQDDFREAMARIVAGMSVDERDVITSEAVSATMTEIVEEFLDYRPASTGRQERESSVAALLSLREMEVLQLVAEGKTAAHIARSLFVSPHTIKRHMANIRQKLGVRSQAAAVAALQRTR